MVSFPFSGIFLRFPVCKILLLLSLFFLNSLAGIGTRFLIVPATVSEMSLGPSPVIGDQPHFNPSRITSVRSLSVVGGNWLAEIPISGIKATGPLLGGRYALYGRYAGIDDLELRPEYPVDEPLSEFSAYGLSFTGAYARTVDRISVGGSITYIDLGIYSEFSRGISFSFGAELLVLPRVRVAASILNVGGMSDFRNKKPTLPVRSSMGAVYDHSWKNWKNKIAVSADITKGSEPVLRLAEEVTWNKISIMAGTGFQKNNFNISGGINFKAASFKIGYGFMVGQNRLGIAQVVGIAFDIE